MKKIFPKHPKTLAAMILSGCFILLPSTPAFAQRILGTPSGGWTWMDTNADGIYECYYRNFDYLNSLDDAFRLELSYPNEYTKNNYIRTTPDGYQINAAAQWIVNGVVQTKTVDSEVNAERQSALEPYYQQEVRKHTAIKMIDSSKKSSLTAPSPDQNAELFSLFRKKYPGSELDQRVLYFIRYGYTPLSESSRSSFTTFSSELMSFTQSKPTANVLNVMAGRPAPFPDQWGPRSQFLYDWFVNFLKSKDWANMSEYDRAYGVYEYLGSTYKYGKMPIGENLEDDGAEGTSEFARIANSKQFTCEQFAHLYYILGTSVGLEVGFEGIDTSKGNYNSHVFNIIKINGINYMADASGYSKYHEKDSYFGVFKKHFYYDISYKSPYFQNVNVSLTPIEEVYCDFPGTTLKNPLGQDETLWHAVANARQYP